MRTIVGFMLFALLVVGVMPASAQSGFDFDNGADGAVLLDTIETVDIGSAVNVRPIPSVHNNTTLFTASVGSVAELVGEYEWRDGTVWNLARVYSAAGNYVGFGWVSRSTANFTARTASYPTLRTADCSLTTGGRQATVEVLYNEGWVWDTESTNCNILVEGRPLGATDDTHHYWAVRDRHWRAGTGNYANDAQITQYVDNGVVTALEGAVWIYPVRWNMSDTRADDSAIVMEFARQKRDGGAEYPLVLHDLRGSTRTIIDDMLTDVVAQDSDDFDGLTVINVTGVRGSNGQMTASVGAVDMCWLFIGQRDTDDDLEVERRCGMVEGFSFYDTLDMPAMFWVIPNQNTWNNDAQRATAADLMQPVLIDYVIEHGDHTSFGVDAYGFGSHFRSGTYEVSL